MSVVLKYEQGIPIFGKTVPMMRAPKRIRAEHEYGFTRGRISFTGEGDDGTEQEPHRAADARLGRQMYDLLHAKYPGHLWRVQVRHDLRVALITLPLLHEQPYVIHLRNLTGDPGLTRVMRAGGQMLERHKLPRAGFRVDDLVAAMARYGNPALTRGEAPPE